MHNKKCKLCGKPFLTANLNTKYCSPDCKKEARKRMEHQRWEDEKGRRCRKKPSTLSETNRLAREAGMSYGKYIAMKYMEEQRNASTM